MRLFIAVNMPEAVKGAIEQAQTELRARLPQSRITWSKREQFHLTLKFLGAVEPGALPALTQAIRDACRGFASLQLRAERIGFFPDLRRPRVVWVGVHDKKEELLLVQTAVESAVKGFSVEKPEGKFAGHVTLGRCQEIRKPQVEVLTRLASHLKETVFGEWTEDKVELIRSEF